MQSGKILQYNWQRDIVIDMYTLYNSLSKNKSNGKWSNILKFSSLSQLNSCILKQ